MAKFMPACKRIQGNLWRYIDRELSAPALAEISAHLKACRECQRIFEARACDAKLYRMAFVESPFGESFVERFRHRLDGQPAPVDGAVSREAVSREAASRGAVSRGALASDASPAKESMLRRSVLRYFPGRGAGVANPRRFLARVALAAALMTIGVSILYGLRPDASLGTVAVARGDSTLKRGGKVLPAPARDLRPGDRFLLDGPGDELKINLADGSELFLSGPADFLVDEASRGEGRFIGRLEEGELRASVRHREKDQEMKFYSPDALARVVGTRFLLRVEPRRGTTLDVQEGEVRFRWYGGEEVPVNATTGPSFASSGGASRPALSASPEKTIPTVPLAGAPAEASPGAGSPPEPAAASGRPDLDRPVEEKPAPEIPRQIREGVDLPVPR